ncbi:MAG: hypothetical protein HY782_07640 [Chloroflexi bacterium]|nr:hypothetical protein [Chloroflexota bacterium]
MKHLRLVLFLVLFLTFALIGTADAQGPRTVTGVSFNPTSGKAGSTTTMTIQFNVAVGDLGVRNSFCIYTSEADGTWTYTPSVSNLGDTYTQTVEGCADVTNYDDTLISVADPNDFADGGDTLNITVVAPGGISTGAKTFVVRQYKDALPGTLINTLNGTYTILATPTTVYASDQSNCGGYGSAGYSCFQSLATAIANSNSEVVIVGNLTSDSGGATLSSGNVTLIRGISTPVLAAPSGCSASPLTVSKSGVTVRDFTINGASCNTQTGLAIANNTAVTNMTIQNFSGTNGKGISIATVTGASVTNSTLTNNYYGINVAVDVTIGSGPSTGNTIQNGGTGINHTAGTLTAKGNTITGNSTAGASVTGSPSAFYGNRIYNNGTTQINCNTGTGAAFNYLGGSSPNSGTTNCTDVKHQLGANWVTWADSTNSLNELTVTGGPVAIFDLGDNKPFNVGTDQGLPNLTSNFYAVTGAITPTISTSGKLYFTVPEYCTSSGNTQCWYNTQTAIPAGTTVGRHFVKGTTSPTAVTLSSFTASAQDTPQGNLALPALGLAVAGVAVLGGVWFVRRARR